MRTLTELGRNSIALSHAYLASSHTLTLNKDVIRVRLMVRVAVSEISL